jgi:hypothetical protein
MHMKDERTDVERRADILAAYAVRAIYAARAQRRRLADADPIPADHDLDFYAHAAWLLRETAHMAKARLVLVTSRIGDSASREGPPAMKAARFITS